MLFACGPDCGIQLVLTHPPRKPSPAHILPRAAARCRWPCLASQRFLLSQPFREHSRRLLLPRPRPTLWIAGVHGASHIASRALVLASRSDRCQYDAPPPRAAGAVPQRPLPAPASPPSPSFPPAPQLKQRRQGSPAGRGVREQLVPSQTRQSQVRTGLFPQQGRLLPPRHPQARVAGSLA